MSREPFTEAGRLLAEALGGRTKAICAIEDEVVALYACGHRLLGGTCDRPRGHAGAHELNLGVPESEERA